MKYCKWRNQLYLYNRIFDLTTSAGTHIIIINQNSKFFGWGGAAIDGRGGSHWWGGLPLDGGSPHPPLSGNPCSVLSLLHYLTNRWYSSTPPLSKFHQNFITISSIQRSIIKSTWGAPFLKISSKLYQNIKISSKSHQITSKGNSKFVAQLYKVHCTLNSERSYNLLIP